MLNTESRLSATLIWLAIAAMGLQFVWTLLQLPPPLAAAVRLQQSQLADWLVRNQVMVTGLTGFGGLALAYLVDGWRNRAGQRRAADEAETRLAAVLAREAGSIAAHLEEATRALESGRPAGAHRAAIADPLEAHDLVLMAAPISELAMLGAGPAAAIGGLRRSARRVLALASSRDETADRQLGEAVHAALDAARSATVVLTVRRDKGAAAADRLRILPSRSSGMTVLDAPAATRLLPAA